jgi:ATP-dependent Clp protease adaptor protein ClpS
MNFHPSNTASKPWEKEETDLLTELDTTFNLIVWNDEVNTFEWVIETLIKICHHTPEQAEQCALFIHTKGKYGVKSGDYDTLKPMCDAINERGIGATIEAISN